MRQPNTDSRYATLDGLRGAAAMVVVFVHFHALYHLPEIEHGYLAVDLFFAMSGFVIANAYDRKLSSGELNWQKYFVLRLFRLYPLYFAGLALGVAALAYRLPASDWHQIASAVPGTSRRPAEAVLFLLRARASPDGGGVREGVSWSSAWAVYFVVGAGPSGSPWSPCCSDTRWFAQSASGPETVRSDDVQQVWRSDVSGSRSSVRR